MQPPRPHQIRYRRHTDKIRYRRHRNFSGDTNIRNNCFWKCSSAQETRKAEEKSGRVDNSGDGRGSCGRACRLKRSPPPPPPPPPPLSPSPDSEPRCDGDDVSVLSHEAVDAGTIPTDFSTDEDHAGSSFVQLSMTLISLMGKTLLMCVFAFRHSHQQ
jgi:hypothetical protein